MRVNKNKFVLSVVPMLLFAVLTTSAAAQDESPLTHKSDSRWHVIAHDFTVYGVDYRVFVKLDHHSGQTWRFHAFNMKWIEIEEPKTGPDGSSAQPRYELHVHDARVNGVPVEFLIRVDRFTGHSWIYNGNYPAWKLIPSEG